jgi:hypothetical protein
VAASASLQINPTSTASVTVTPPDAPLVPESQNTGRHSTRTIFPTEKGKELTFVTGASNKENAGLQGERKRGMEEQETTTAGKGRGGGRGRGRGGRGRGRGAKRARNEIGEVSGR